MTDDEIREEFAKLRESIAELKHLIVVLPIPIRNKKKKKKDKVRHEVE